METDFRYCPSCGTRNIKTDASCVRCGLVFSRFKPAPVLAQAGKEERSHMSALLLAIVAILFVSFTSYILWIQKSLVPNKNTTEGSIQLLTVRAETLFQRLLHESTEKELNLIHTEIQGLLTFINVVPESQDVEANLMLQKILIDMERGSHFPLVLDAKMQSSIQERFTIIDKRFNLHETTGK